MKAGLGTSLQPMNHFRGRTMPPAGACRANQEGIVARRLQHAEAAGAVQFANAFWVVNREGLARPATGSALSNGIAPVVAEEFEDGGNR